ncbi:hypothetical protein QR680_010062 [Steinernema hermaphroditum]|uniref:Uncharacterized protein n=1 Tax=Steinernema hermaphroditum TaxID=289476 RepID=A0AA39MAV0_9BILA|nr:hypothetical protein QR680_010062 [Steinernema hermaphroditum]
MQWGLATNPNTDLHYDDYNFLNRTPMDQTGMDNANFQGMEDPLQVHDSNDGMWHDLGFGMSGMDSQAPADENTGLYIEFGLPLDGSLQGLNWRPFVRRSLRRWHLKIFRFFLETMEEGYSSVNNKHTNELFAHLLGLIPGNSKIHDPHAEEKLRCPRCANRLEAMCLTDFVDTDGVTYQHIWWTCRGLRDDSCDYPLDMPSNVFWVKRTMQQRLVGFTPLPNIEEGRHCRDKDRARKRRYKDIKSEITDALSSPRSTSGVSGILSGSPNAAGHKNAEQNLPPVDFETFKKLCRAAVPPSLRSMSGLKAAAASPTTSSVKSGLEAATVLEDLVDLRSPPSTSSPCSEAVHQFPALPIKTAVLRENNWINTT